MIQEFSQIYQTNLLTLCIHLWIDLGEKMVEMDKRKIKVQESPLQLSNEWISYNQKLGTKAGFQDSFVIYEQFRSKLLKTRHRVESAHFEMKVTSRYVARDNKLFQLQPIFFSLNQVNKKVFITSGFFVF